MSEEFRTEDADGVAPVEGGDPSAAEQAQLEAHGVASEHPGMASEHPGVPSGHPGMASEHPGVPSGHPGAHPGASEHPGVASGYPSQAPPSEPAVAAPQEKKPKKRKKIDLKSRLSSVRASGSMAAKSMPSDRKSDPLSFPPPPTGSVPAPKFGGMPSPLVSSPFAPPEEKKKPSAAQQTIKVEMGEEVVQERKRATKRTALYAVLAALLASILGFFIGQVRERGARGHKAIENAAALATDIEAANLEMTEMSDALRAAVEKLRTDEFPEELGDALKQMNVPFGPENFQGRAVGGLPPDVLSQLITYTSGVEKLNKQKDKLQRLLSGVQKPVAAYLAAKEKPTIKYSVLLGKKKDDYFADFAINAEPFEAKSDWPSEYSVQVRGAKGKPQEVEVKRWDGKSQIGGGDDKVALPVDVKGLPEALSDKLPYVKLVSEITDTKQLIDGNDSPIPQQQTDGLLKDGKQLVEGLKKVSTAGG